LHVYFAAEKASTYRTDEECNGGFECVGTTAEADAQRAKNTIALNKVPGFIFFLGNIYACR
jgi:hypothetical protein